MTDQPAVARITRETHSHVLHVNQDWWKDVKAEYTEFDTFKNYFKKDAAVERIAGFEDEDGIQQLIHNPPDEWIDDEDLQEDVLIGVVSRLVAQHALAHIADEEYNTLSRLLDNEDFKMVIMRMSAFFEEFLSVQCMMKLRDEKMEDIANKDLDLVEEMGHSDRIRLARLLLVLDEKQHGYLQRMASRRNEIAHTPWSSIDEEKEEDIRDAAIKAHDALYTLFDDLTIKTAVPG
jgi:hypothetical protein